MAENLPDTIPTPIPDDLVKKMAMDIGKEIVTYIEWMYPKAIEATSSSFSLAIRNSIYNEIMAALKLTTERDILEWLDRRKAERRQLMKMVRQRRSRSEEEWEAIRGATDA